VLEPVRLIIPGRPCPKKNSPEFGRRFGSGKPIVRQTPQYLAWEARAVVELWNQWTRPKLGRRPPLEEELRISCWFYEHPMQRFDLAGVFQAVCDALQKARVIKNDRLIRQSGEMAIHRDRVRPRVEFVLEAAIQTEGT
jgi:hypothetical protein